MLPDEDDIDTDPALTDPLTPCETPDAKKGSGQFGARECPACEGLRHIVATDGKGGTLDICIPCRLCIDPKTGEPCGVVSHFKAAAWMLEQGRSLDSEPPK